MAPRDPGRLGDSNMTIMTDPRTHPRISSGLKNLGLTHSSVGPLANRDSSIEEIMAYERVKEAGIEALCGTIDFLRPVPGDATAWVRLTKSEEFIPGPDGNEIKLIIYRPDDIATPLPCVLYYHGGAMVNLHTVMPMLLTWVQGIARRGIVAIVVDFRNASDPSGHVPFPGGLNDCAAARWANAHRSRLGITKIVLQGDSGGANLVMATALKTNEEGWDKEIDGVYATAPYISNAYREGVQARKIPQPHRVRWLYD